MRQTTADGIVLKRRNIGEADRLLTLFTRKNGKITVKASGVRKIHSRRASHVETLHYSTFSLYVGKGIPIVTEVTTVNSYTSLQKDLKTLGLAYYLCELICELCPENQEQQEIFFLFKKALEDLCITNAPITVIRRFERELLVALGYHTTGAFAHIEDHGDFIEGIIEKKLKTRQVLLKFT